MLWNRREILTAFLGLPWALAACGKSPTITFDGEIVGASHAAGHLLRSSLPHSIEPSLWRETRNLIVGGGASGLAAAWRLRHAGEAAEVIELEPVVGGTSRSGRTPRVAYPWGAHYVPAPSPNQRALVRLLSEMDVFEGRDDRGEWKVREELLCRDPQERVFYRGRWYEGLYLRVGASEEDLRQWQAFEGEIAAWSRWRDARGRSAFTIPVSQASTDPEVLALDRQSMGDWLDERGFRSPRLRWWVDYACKDDYGLTAAQTSAWAGIFYFAARNNGGIERPFMTWPEGNGRLIAHLRKRADATIATGRLVVRIDPGSEGAPVRVVTVNAKGQDPIGIRADRVIFAAPLFLAPTLIPKLPDERKQTAARLDRGAWLVANLHLRARTRDRGFPLAWDNVLYESPALGYVVATHQADLDHGGTVLTYYYPLCGDDPRAERQRLLDLDWEGWCEVVLSDLGRAHPELRTLVERIDIMRWGHAMIRPVPELRSSGVLANAAESWRGIHFAGTDLSGVALFEEAFDHGVRAAEEVLAAHGIASESFR